MAHRQHESSSLAIAACSRGTPVSDHGARSFRPAVVVLALTSVFVLGGCETIKGIFKAGFGLGVLVVVAVVATIGGIVAMVRKK